MPSKHIGDLLKSSNNGDLSKALRRTEAIGRLTKVLSEALPAELGAAILAAGVDDAGVLTVKARSSAWASRLRFETDAIAAAARNAGVTVSEIRVRVGRGAQA